jgi:hypothetical protein
VTTRVGYAVLCDHAVTDAAGKHVLVGVFDRIFVKETPSTHGRCYFAVELRGIPGKVAVRVLVRDDAGGDILPAIGPLPIPLSNEYGGGNFILEFHSLPLPRLGQYHILVEVDGKVAGERVLYVEKRPG